MKLRAKKKIAAAAKFAPMVRFHFGDGSSEAISLVEAEFQLLKQYAWMSVSDNPDLKASGLRKLREAAELIAKAQHAQLHGMRNRHIARPKAKSPLRTSITTMMKVHKQDGTEFKLFLAGWETGVYAGLRIVPPQHKDNIDPVKYLVVDENSDTDLRGLYTLGSLTVMYSESA